MLRLANTTQHYPWGSSTAIPELLGEASTGMPVAELWLGAHPSAPSRVGVDGSSVPLDAYLAADPPLTLGQGVVERFGTTLPYLLKVIAAERPLSLQVHPHRERARAGFDAETAAGIPLDAPERNYRDANHKPELVYALTRFEAMCGFRAPRRAAELLGDLDAPLARRLAAVLHADREGGMRGAFRSLLEPATRPSRDEIAAVAEACRVRLELGSPSPRADRTVVRLAEEYPGDPGVVTSLLLNPVTLQPGEAMFVPAGGVHAYLSGVGVEVMASSDNVLRAGLTGKHIDIPELLANVDYVAAPPIRIAPERFNVATQVFYAPVDDFELSVTSVSGEEPQVMPGRGPRILLCLEGETTVTPTAGPGLTLRRGQSAFAPATDGTLSVSGHGVVIQADAP